ncbi:DUF6254 family protein [Neobacillus sp. LXY-4]
MSQSKHEAERLWRVRKEAQHPHGKIKSLEQIADEVGKNKNK